MKWLTNGELTGRLGKDSPAPTKEFSFQVGTIETSTEQLCRDNYCPLPDVVREVAVADSKQTLPPGRKEIDKREQSQFAALIKEALAEFREERGSRTRLAADGEELLFSQNGPAKTTLIPCDTLPVPVGENKKSSSHNIYKNVCDVAGSSASSSLPKGWQVVFGGSKPQNKIAFLLWHKIRKKHTMGEVLPHVTADDLIHELEIFDMAPWTGDKSGNRKAINKLRGWVSGALAILSSYPINVLEKTKFFNDNHRWETRYIYTGGPMPVLPGVHA